MGDNEGKGGGTLGSEACANNEGQRGLVRITIRLLQRDAYAHIVREESQETEQVKGS